MLTRLLAMFVVYFLSHLDNSFPSFFSVYVFFPPCVLKHVSNAVPLHCVVYASEHIRSTFAAIVLVRHIVHMHAC